MKIPAPTLAKRFLTNAVLTVLTCAAMFGLSEIVVRLLYKETTVLFPRYHTDYQYGRYVIRGVRPNSTYWLTSVDGSWKFTTNSKGFRNTKDFNYNKPPSTFRVLSLGDSHTQGYEVRQDYTFSAVLERVLRHQGQDAEVINAGVSGFGTAEELVFLENEGIRYMPDVIVLGFFANDFEDNLKAGLFGLDERKQLIEKKYEHIPGVKIQNLIYGIPVVRWLGENSYFYSMLFNSVWEYFKIRLGAFAAQQAVPNDASPTARVQSQTEYAVPTKASVSTYEMELTAALIERMQRFCMARGIRFIVVDIPTTAASNRYNSSVPPELRERFSAARIEFISSEDVLKRFDGAAEFHVPHGHRHISEFTHTVIGIEIGNRLSSSNIRREVGDK